MQKFRSRNLGSKILVFGFLLGLVLYLFNLSPQATNIVTAQEKGDPKAGEALFKDTKGLAALACINCHKVKGEGSDIGPDLSKIGEKPPEYLRESVVKPSAVIAPGYEILEIKMKDGKTVHTGLKKGETDAELKFMDINDPDLKIVSVQKKDVESTTPQPDSFMFSFEKVLKPEQLENILAYLQTLK
jgi:putative heme-binding domain-containing protein